MDLECYDDLSAFAAELDDPVAELAQDLYHRLIEPPGSNIDDPDRGLGITDLLNGPFNDKIGPSIEAEFRKDDRVLGATATVTPLADVDGGYRASIEIEVDTGRLGIVVEADGLGTIRRIA